MSTGSMPCSLMVATRSCTIIVMSCAISISSDIIVFPIWHSLVVSGTWILPGSWTCLVRHGDESSYVLRFVALIDHAEQKQEPMGLDVCCLHQPHNWYYLIRDADHGQSLDMDCCLKIPNKFLCRWSGSVGRHTSPVTLKIDRGGLFWVLYRILFIRINHQWNDVDSSTVLKKNLKINFTISSS